MKRDVRMEIEGSLLERLLERALAEGACFAEVRRVSPGKISVQTDERSAQQLLQLCERYRLKCALCSHDGISAFLQKLRRRWTLLPACLLCLLLSLAFLTRLWRIELEFTGPAAGLGERAQILESIEAAGLRTGMALREIDTDLLQARLLADCEGYSFIGVRRQGIRLLVEAAPEQPSPPLYDRDFARDLVAQRDGVVLSVSVRSGTACVKPGDTVRCGQTLIRGEEQKSKEESAPVSALGEVTARCWFDGSAEGKLTEEITLPTGESREECRLKLLGLSLPITRCEAFPSEETSMEILPVAGLYLPLEIERSIHLETRTELRSVDPEQLEKKLTALAQAEVMAQISREAAEAQSLSMWTDCTAEGGMLHVRCTAEISADIAVARSELH